MTTVQAGSTFVPCALCLLPFSGIPLVRPDGRNKPPKPPNRCPAQPRARGEQRASGDDGEGEHDGES